MNTDIVKIINAQKDVLNVMIFTIVNIVQLYIIIKSLKEDLIVLINVYLGL